MSLLSLASHTSDTLFQRTGSEQIRPRYEPSSRCNFPKTLVTPDACRHGEPTGQVYSTPVDSDSAADGSAAENESADMGSQRLLSPKTDRSMHHNEFARFASEEGFIHVTSSPRYPQSHGKAERTVQTVKAILKKSVDPYGALLAYRTTSLECGYSQAQLLMGRQLRTSIPVMASTLQPRWEESKQLRDRQDNIKTWHTFDYDRYHRAQPLSTLSAGDPVWM